MSNPDNSGFRRAVASLDDTQFSAHEIEKARRRSLGIEEEVSNDANRSSEGYSLLRSAYSVNKNAKIDSKNEGTIRRPTRVARVPTQVMKKKLGGAFEKMEMDIITPKASKPVSEQGKSVHRTLAGRKLEGTLQGKKKKSVVDPKLQSMYESKSLQVESIVDNIEKNMESNKTTLTLSELQKEAEAKWLILPESRFKLIWDSIILALVVIFVGYKEVYWIAFKDARNGAGILLFVDILFLFDMLITFSTCIPTKRGNNIEIKREIIAKEYLKLWFWVDLLSFVPTIALLAALEDEDENFLYWQSLRMLRFLKINRIIQQFSRVQSISPRAVALLSRLVIVNVFWNWTACLYWYVAATSLPANLYNDQVLEYPKSFDTGPNSEGPVYVKDSVAEDYYEDYWAPPPEVLNDPDQGPNLYATSFFWAVMVTTGNGRDIKPANEIEYAVSIIFIFIGFGIYAFIIGGVTNSLNAYESDAMKIRSKLQSVDWFLKKRDDLPQALKDRVRNWYMYSYSRKGLGSIMFEEKFDDLQESLSLELKLFMRMPIVQSVPLFALIDNSMCTIEIIEKLVPQLMIPDEIIFNQDEISDGLYILVEGEVEVRRKLKGASEESYVVTLYSKSIFGEISLLLNQPRNSTVAAVTHSEALKLSRRHFEEIMKSYPVFFRAMKKMANEKSDTGWNRVRRLLRVAYTSRVFGIKNVPMREILGEDPMSESVDSSSILSKDQLYKNNAQVYQHYVYKTSKQLRMIQKRDQLVKKVQRDRPTLYKRKSAKDLGRHRSIVQLQNKDATIKLNKN